MGRWVAALACFAVTLAMSVAVAVAQPSADEALADEASADEASADEAPLDDSAQGAVKSKRIAVYVEGTERDAILREVRDDIVGLLPENVEVVRNRTFQVALYKLGVRYQLGNHIAIHSMRTMLLSVIRTALRRTESDGAIIIRLRRSRQLKREAYALFVTHDKNELIVDRTVALHAEDPVRRIAELEEALRPAIDMLAPDVELTAPEPEQEEVVLPPPPKPDKPPEPPPEEDDDHEANMALFSVDAAYRLAGRWMDYGEVRTLNLRPYEVFGAHMVAVSGEVFPFRGVAVAEHLGLAARFSRAFGVQTEGEGGEVIGNTHDVLRVGLRLRFRTGDPPAPLLYVNGSFGWTRFQFSREDNPLFDELPDVWYVVGTGGVEIRLPIGPVSLFAGVGYVGPFSGGEVASRFRDVTLHGLEAKAGVAVQLVDFLEARLSGDYSAFFYTIEHQITDRYIADTALDQFAGGQLGVAYLFH